MVFLVEKDWGREDTHQTEIGRNRELTARGLHVAHPEPGPHEALRGLRSRDQRPRDPPTSREGCGGGRPARLCSGSRLCLFTECEERDSLRETVPVEGPCAEPGRLGSALAGPPGRKPSDSQLRKQDELQARGKSDDISVLHKDIRDLKAQLQTANKVIQNLKSRVRSLSVTSDYSSSLERPRKLKALGALEASSPQSVTDEDEGWLSDGTGAFSPPGLQAQRELEGLLHRVSQLEARLPKTGPGGQLAEELRSASWPGYAPRGLACLGRVSRCVPGVGRPGGWEGEPSGRLFQWETEVRGRTGGQPAGRWTVAVSGGSRALGGPPGTPLAKRQYVPYGGVSRVRLPGVVPPGSGPDSPYNLPSSFCAGSLIK